MFMWYASVVLILSLQCSSECYGQNEDLTGLKFEDSDLVIEHDTWPEEDPLEQSTVTSEPVTEQPQEPTAVTVTPLPLNGSDHELFFNVTWDPPTGPKVHTYSLEVHSETNTLDCRLANFCYETDIPGDALWSAIPAQPSLDSDGCAVRPACAYLVKLIANTRDGHTYADVHVELDECVAGVCSCGHAPRLPTPVVSAKTVPIRGDLFVNVSWSLPVPLEPLRLPPRLRKKRYFISIGNLVKLVHTGPEWITHIVSPQAVDAYGFVVIPDRVQWRLLQISKRGDERSGARSGDGPPRRKGVDLKLVAHVSLEDDRGCRGPAGNATVYDPNEKRPKIQVASGVHFQALWAVFGGACVLVMVTILAIGARAVKRVLKEFRPEPVVPASLQPLRPNWLQLDT